ncbi:MAG TPA: hypothetical protein VIC62_18530 [Nakamurella sp.]|jgi:hypothetical protein
MSSNQHHGPDRASEGPDPRQQRPRRPAPDHRHPALGLPDLRRPRGDVRSANSYDGSRRLTCDGWTNPCGHIDYYADARREAHR